jgi:hypothetical protein
MIEHFRTGRDFSSQFNLDFCLEQYSGYRTPGAALQSGKIKIRELVDCYGDRLIIAWLKAWLVNLSHYMDFDINTSQGHKTAMFILEECYMLNLAEISLLFKKIMKGNYGEFYNKFNGQIILRACREYRKERGRILSRQPTTDFDMIGKKIKEGLKEYNSKKDENYGAGK